MPSAASWVRFAAAALVLVVIPGPGVLYVVARSIGQGRRAGLVSALGLSTGVLVHVVAVTLGVSAIVFASATAFAIVKMIGAVYLIYLGLQVVLARGHAATQRDPPPRPPRRLFADGVFVSAANPQVAVFFVAFLPQFVEPSRGWAPSQLLVLGLTYIGLALVTDSAYALLAGGLRTHLGGALARHRLPRYLGAAVYLGLGVSAAFTGRSP